MGRPAWANDAQWTFLLGHVERYMTVKGTKATKDFWPGLFDGWVAEWPNLPLNSLIPSAGSLEEGTNPESQAIVDKSSEHPESMDKACSAGPSLHNDSDPDNDLPSGTSQPIQTGVAKNKSVLTWRKVNILALLLQMVSLIYAQRLKQFINNHTRVLKDKGHQQKLDLSGKKRSPWQPYQVYSHLYYKKKGLKAQIHSEYEKYLTELLPDAKGKTLFSFTNRRLCEMLEVESEDVKAIVEITRQKGVMVKEDEALKKMLETGMLEEDYHKEKRKL